MPTTGVGSDATVQGGLGPLRDLAGTRRAFVTNRRPDLPRGMTMAELAAEHAEGLRKTFASPVDLMGVSTGGSIAQQLAADHPDVVRRLVIGSSACRLGTHGRTLQAEVGQLVRAGRIRSAAAVFARGLVPPWRGQALAGAAAYLLAPLALKDHQGLADMATTIEAEDSFDLARCENPVAAATLVVGGSKDRFYEPQLFEETVALIPGSRLHLVIGQGHIGALQDKGTRAAVAAFLAV